MTGFETQNILIIDGDISYGSQLCECLKKNDYTNIELLRDGSRVIDYVKNARPFAIIMDIILPGIDGLQLLKQLQELKCEGIDTSVIVVSAFYSEKYIRDAAMLGVYSYLIKPMQLEGILIKLNELKNQLNLSVSKNFSVREVAGEQKGFSVQENISFSNGAVSTDTDETTKRMRTLIKITKLLHDMGIPAHLCGHDYLRDAIIMVMDSHEVSGRMTKEIYPEIASKYKKSPQSVERAIRTALDVAWTRGKTELINDIFRFTVNIQKGRPTNSEFVSLIADYLNYDYAGVV